MCFLCCDCCQALTVNVRISTCYWALLSLFLCFSPISLKLFSFTASVEVIGEWGGGGIVIAISWCGGEGKSWRWGCADALKNEGEHLQHKLEFSWCTTGQDVFFLDPPCVHHFVSISPAEIVHPILPWAFLGMERYISEKSEMIWLDSRCSHLQLLSSYCL